MCERSVRDSRLAWGREGSVLAPIIAGFRFEGGYTLPTVSMLMAFGSTMAAIVLLFLKLGPEGAAGQPAEA